MNQAGTECPDDQPPPPEPKPGNEAGWFLLVLALAVVVFDLWAWRRTKRKRNPKPTKTISQWVKTFLKGPWGKMAGCLILGGLLWHMIFGGPI